MKDEIKEILDNWKYVIDNKITVYGETIAFKQIKQLLDYITNLQEENNLLKQMSKDTYDTSQEIMAELSQENERLKEELKYTVPQVQHNKIITKHLKEKEDYKSRIEKVIEYIKNNICDIEFMKKEYGNHLIDFEVDTTFNDIEKLLNILQGFDNDE